MDLVSLSKGIISGSNGAPHNANDTPNELIKYMHKLLMSEGLSSKHRKPIQKLAALRNHFSFDKTRNITEALLSANHCK